ncbi:aldehyde dehydrogenase family protein [Pseudomonas aeruginosa]|uniref:aldehyde dehydrogenase family protein n=1 Tax=Pseudomonas aeruginosa TaxID=287 RepID=UPI0010A2A016|nr:aldehyde dehydrogenase family protein [Pseudomonas aeruginosa]
MNGHARHWIDGAWLDSAQRGQSFDPASGQPIGTYADGGRAEADAAIAAAVRAFEDGPWKDDHALRAKALEEIAAAFERHADALIDLLALENGKIKPEAAFEVGMVPGKLRYYAGLARSERGASGTPRPDVVSLVLREPMGVAGIIVPWNSPVVLMIRSLAPALAAGTTTVVKMPGQTAQTNAMVARIIAEAPSLPAAGRVISAAGARHLKRFGLELGGKTPHLVFDDADLDAALPVLEKSLTVFAGQFCMTGSRLLVQRGVAERLRERLAQRLENLRVGPAADPRSDMGPLIDKANVERVERAVRQAIAAGARVVVRGGPVTEGELAAGAFYRPTLLEVDDPDLDIVQQETFGPVLTLQVFEHEEEGVALANRSEYGLAAGVWTRDVARAFRVARKIRAGTVWINDWAKVYDEFEEGGYRQSGLGRLNGVAALDDFVEYKHISLTTGAA